VTDVYAKTNGSIFLSCPRADATERKIIKTAKITLTCIGTSPKEIAFFICLLSTESVRLHHPRLQRRHVDPFVLGILIPGSDA
jgi:hypothetical protein